MDTNFNKILINVYDSQYILERSDDSKPSSIKMFRFHIILFLQ